MFCMFVLILWKKSSTNYCSVLIIFTNYEVTRVSVNDFEKKKKKIRELILFSEESKI